MERLTKRLFSGVADYNYPDNCYFDDNAGPDRIAQSAFRQLCIERLATYEDTGLTPDQVLNAKIIIESAFSDDTSKAERIRELLTADRENRVVILPCEAVNGRWLFAEDGIIECSICHETNIVVPGLSRNYCPNCGAKMDKGDTDETN